MKFFTKTLASVLTGAILVNSFSVPSAVYAATGRETLEHTVQNSMTAAAEKGLKTNISSRSVGMENSIKVDMESGLEAELENTVFNGTNIVTVTDENETQLFRDNIKSADALKLSVTFKLAADAGQFTNLCEISNTQLNTESMLLIINKNGTVYLMTGSAKNGTSGIVSCNTPFEAGQFYTLDIILTADNITCQVNGGAEYTINPADKENDARKTMAFLKGFFGKETSAYTDWRERIDSIAIGGRHENSYQDSPTWENLKGTISHLSIGKYNAVTGDGLAEAMFANGVHDSSWLFGGGAETQGRFSEIEGVRNYIGHFEEYIRSVKGSGNVEGRQRCTVNAGTAELDAVSFAAKLDGLINKTAPKAVTYFIGAEDYSNGETGIAAFQAAITSILNKSLAMKDNTGCAVLQLPHAVKSASAAANAELYANAAKEAFNEIASKDSEKAKRMVIVDHLAQTNSDSFKNSNLTTDDLLNAKGHYEISKQFTEAVYGSISGFPSITGTWTKKDSPENYLQTIPEVRASQNGLTVAMPESVLNAEWRYILSIDGVEITGEEHGASFTIDELPTGKSYKLTVQTKDGKTQYAAAAGVIRDGDQAKAPEIAEAIPQAIQQKAADKSKPLTWLFMGDSITHAAVHTKGYDGIAQLFEKYVKEDLGRTDDIVVNTAASGATVPNTLDYLEQRLTKYHPDIVSVMIGTNDARDRDNRQENANYSKNLKTLIEKIREANPEAIIIFRSPTPGIGGTWKPGPEGPNGTVARMRAVAKEDGNILFIDQFTEWDEAFAAYPYLSREAYFLGDNTVHPSAAGHLWMTEKFIRECGLNTNTKIANFEYEFSYARTNSSIKPEVTAAENQESITVSKKALQTKYGTSEILGDLEVRLTSSDGKTYTKQGTLSEESIIIGDLPSGSYTVKVTANIKGNTAKKVVFAETEVTLKKSSADEEAANAVIQKIQAIGNVTYTSECLQKIEEARKLYDGLTEEQKALISADELKVLTDAETAYDTLKQEQDKIDEQKKKDQIAADAVKAKINAIGTVTNTSSCQQKISEARTAYNKLTEPQKKLIPASVLKTLTNAESALRKLQQEAQVKSFTSGNYKYKVIDAAKQTVKVIGTVKKKAAITIPSSVTYKGKKYKVISISSKAFQNNKKATKVTIGKYVQDIGSQAFAECKKIKTVTINSASLTKISPKAFYNCKALKKITIKSRKLKSVGKNTFKGIAKNAVIKVPSSKLKSYKRILSNKGQGKNVKIKK